MLLERGDDVVVLLLDADDAFGRADHLHGLEHSAQERLGEVVQEFLVLVQQGLALGGVGDDERDAGGQLDGGGESAAAGPDDAKFGNAGECHLCVGLAAPASTTPDSGAMLEYFSARTSDPPNF